MKKTHKIVYWIATAWLSLGMLSTGIVQLLRNADDVQVMADLGYPVYILTILGIWKVLGVAAVLMPRLPVLKEWAYAGFFFAMSGAIFSHVASGAPNGIFPALLLLTLTVVSWYFRPPDRKITPHEHKVAQAIPAR